MKKSLTKTQFLDEYKDAVNHELELSLKRKQAASLISILEDTLCDHATDEHGVKIPGFLKMSVGKTKERMGRNPATGEKIKIKSKIKGKITMLKAMKDRLSEIGAATFGKSSKVEKHGKHHKHHSN
jgi:DNA-binding protein HU-beta